MRFIIHEGKEFSCEFVIKQPGASVPLDITGSTGAFTLATIGPNSLHRVGPVDMTINSELDGQNGIFTLILTAEQTTGLIGDKAFAEDGYPLIPTHTAALDIVHPEEGNIFVDIAKIYVKNIGV